MTYGVSYGDLDYTINTILQGSLQRKLLKSQQKKDQKKDQKKEQKKDKSHQKKDQKKESQISQGKRPSTLQQLQELKISDIRELLKNAGIDFKSRSKTALIEKYIASIKSS